MKAKNIDFVLPCYNPPADFAKSVIETFHKIEKLLQDRKVQLYIVNDGSVKNFTDTQIEQLQVLKERVKIISYPTNRGKGFALRKAIKETTSPLVVYTDYDFPFSFHTKMKLIEELDKGADVVMIKRNHDYLEVLPPLRKIYSIGSRLLNKYFLGMKYPEAQGGLKGFNERGKEIFLKTTIDEFLFDSEFIYRASLNRNISIACITGEIREGIRPNKVPVKVITREFVNFLKILKLRFQ